MAVVGGAALLGAALTFGAARALTDAQAARGALAYAQSCASCHGPRGDDGFAPALVGADSLRRFAGTRELYAYTRGTMPLAAPGSLSAQVYLDLTAWMLQQRGAAADGAELTAATLDATPLDPARASTPAAAEADGRRSLRVVRSSFSEPAPHLAHNLPDLRATIDGQTAACDFLAHYHATGGLRRWGFPTSEVLEERPNAFTQYYQRGVVDCHQRAGAWRMERRLAWDYLGGGVGGAPDLGVEPELLSGQPGERLGPWGHRVSNAAVDGTPIGFLDFFQALGGVASFGFPKTEARRDDDPRAVLGVPGASPGFIRQYFQSSVLEYHPGDPEPVKLRLLGDDLRNRLYPQQAYRAFASFGPARPLGAGAAYAPERVTVPSAA